MKIQLSIMASATLFLAACATSPTTASSVKPYPSKTCAVTKNDLHSMGGPVTKVYGDREVKFCCRPCVAEFEAKQASYLSKI